MADYIHNRLDGGTIHCYGKVEETSNFNLVCEDEYADGVWTDNESCTTWRQVCEYLELNFRSDIAEIEAV